VNYARRTECNRCKAPKPMKGGKNKPGGIQIGKHLAEKSKGLFSAEDWQCATCGNVNWARRSDCNLCHAPKFGKLEERTGAGGGFNERGTVEYKSDVESDGEYDDFGRPKKKRQASSSTPSEPLPKEESGDEDDLGRYALDTDEDGTSSGSSSSSSDSEEENKKRSNKMSNKKTSSKSPIRSDRKKSRSRSRSRSSRNDRSRSRDRQISRDRKLSSTSRDRKLSSTSRDQRDSRSTSRKRSRSPIRKRRISRGSPDDRKDRYLNGIL